MAPQASMQMAWLFNSSKMSQTLFIPNMVIIPKAGISSHHGRINNTKASHKWKEFGSLENEINKKFEVEHKPPIHRDSSRCGAIGYKMGMTSVCDQWGSMIP